MPQVTVSLPASLTAPEPPRDYACDAGNVGEALRDVVRQSPRLEQRLFYGERLLVVVVLNGAHVAPNGARDAVLADGDHLELLVPVAGG